MGTRDKTNIIERHTNTVATKFEMSSNNETENQKHCRVLVVSLISFALAFLFNIGWNMEMYSIIHRSIIQFINYKLKNEDDNYSKIERIATKFLDRTGDDLGWRLWYLLLLFFLAIWCVTYDLVRSIYIGCRNMLEPSVKNPPSDGLPSYDNCC